jgi:hypothetical protein
VCRGEAGVRGTKDKDVLLGWGSGFHSTCAVNLCASVQWSEFLGKLNKYKYYVDVEIVFGCCCFRLMVGYGAGIGDNRIISERHQPYPLIGKF